MTMRVVSPFNDRTANFVRREVNELIGDVPEDFGLKLIAKKLAVEEKKQTGSEYDVKQYDNEAKTTGAPQDDPAGRRTRRSGS